MTDSVTRTVETGEAVREASISRIVLALDVSEAARKASAFAASLAARFGARLYLVHVSPTTAPDPSPSLVAEREAARARFFGDRAALRERRNEQAEPVDVFRRGSVPGELVAFAHEEGADLIVTGTRDGPGRRHFRPGSIAGEIVQRAHVPVLVVPETARVPAPGAPIFERPLVAVDHDAASRATLRLATSLAGESALDVFHALAPSEVEAEPAGTHGRARALERAREELEAWIGEALDDSNPRPRARIAIGRLPDAAVEFAAGADYDLVVCGSRRRALSGSTTEALIDALAVPVVVHREAAA